jgi:hypothetical protein
MKAFVVMHKLHIYKTYKLQNGEVKSLSWFSHCKPVTPDQTMKVSDSWTSHTVTPISSACKARIRSILAFFLPSPVAVHVIRIKCMAAGNTPTMLIYLHVYATEAQSAV